MATSGCIIIFSAGLSTIGSQKSAPPHQITYPVQTQITPQPLVEMCPFRAQIKATLVLNLFSLLQ
jgi:hypothetical protein